MATWWRRYDSTAGYSHRKWGQAAPEMSDRGRACLMCYALTFISLQTANIQRTIWTRRLLHANSSFVLVIAEYVTDTGSSTFCIYKCIADLCVSRIGNCRMAHFLSVLFIHVVFLLADVKVVSCRTLTLEITSKNSPVSKPYARRELPCVRYFQRMDIWNIFDTLKSFFHCLNEQRIMRELSPFNTVKQISFRDL